MVLFRRTEPTLFKLKLKLKWKMEIWKLKIRPIFY